MDLCLFVRERIKVFFFFRRPCRILAWEDGFCNFAASAYDHEGAAAPAAAAAAAYTECAAGEGQEAATSKGLQPELFFKMSHDIYNYGEGYV